MSSFSQTPLMLGYWYVIATKDGMMVAKLQGIYDGIDDGYLEMYLYHTILKVNIDDITFMEIVNNKEIGKMRGGEMNE